MISSPNTIDKIVGLLAAFSTESFLYKGVQYTPKPLRLSSKLLTVFDCNPIGCGDNQKKQFSFLRNRRENEKRRSEHGSKDD